MDNAISQKIKDAVGKSDSIAIVVGHDPSLDEMAAALSMYLLLKEANKKVSIASPSEPIVEISSLVGIDKVQSSLGGDAGDLVVSFPYVEGEIEKVSYTLEDGYLNIIVKAAEQGLSFDDKDIRYIRGSGEIDLLFVIGTPQLADLDDVFDSEKLRDVQIVNIDNKPENQRYGDIVHVSEKYSSVSEQIADLALSLGIHIDHDTAQNLLSGITFATKNFQDPNTSSLAFEMAAFLMKKGANRSRDEQPKDRQDRQDKDRRSRQDRHPDRRQQYNHNNQNQSHQQQFNQRRDRTNDQRRHNQQQQNQQQNRDRARFDEQRQQQRIQDQIRQEQQQQDDEDGTNETPPADWLAPKVYKGSNFEG